MDGKCIFLKEDTPVLYPVLRVSEFVSLYWEHQLFKFYQTLSDDRSPENNRSIYFGTLEDKLRVVLDGMEITF